MKQLTSMAVVAVFWAVSSCAQDKGSGTKDPELRLELVKRMKAEQEVREELEKVSPRNRRLDAAAQQNSEVKAVLEKMEQIDKDNLAWLKSTVAKKGWPTRSMAGPDGSLAAFLIAQHAVTDLEFMKTCLGHVRTAYKKGEADGQWVALMTDRLLILREKKKQLYGTQLRAKDGRLVPEPIEDETNVDRRRNEFGMSPLADYLKAVNKR